MNVLSHIKDLLITNMTIKQLVDNRIRAYEYPDTLDKSKPFIIIEPISVPMLVGAVSNNFLAENHLIDIHVQGYSYDEVKRIQEEVRKVMWANGFKQRTNGLDEYFNETRLYLDVRSYEGVPKSLYFKQKLL